MIGQRLYREAEGHLNASTNREVRLHFLAARRWFGWRDHDPNYDEKERQGQIDAILGADPVAVEGGAFDFWAHRGIISPRRLKDWRSTYE